MLSENVLVPVPPPLMPVFDTNDDSDDEDNDDLFYRIFKPNLLKGKNAKILTTQGFHMF